MNAEQLLRMVFRMVTRMVVRRGLDAGLKKVANKGQSTPSKGADEQRQMASANATAKRMRQANRLVRRVGRL